MSQENEKDWSLALKVANIAPITGSVSIRSSTALAIQRRIEQLEADRAQRGEPVAWRWVWKSKPDDIEGWCYTHTPPKHPEQQIIEPLYTTPQPAQDRAQRGEPVAWRWENKNIKGNWYLSWSKPDARFNQRALYEHPQPAHTEAEVQEIFSAAFKAFNATFYGEHQAAFGDVVRRILGVPKP